MQHHNTSIMCSTHLGDQLQVLGVTLQQSTMPLEVLWIWSDAAVDRLCPTVLCDKSSLWLLLSFVHEFIKFYFPHFRFEYHFVHYFLQLPMFVNVVVRFASR